MDNSHTDPNNQTNLDNSAQSENKIPSKIPTGSSLSYIIKSMGGGKAISALFGMLLLAAGIGSGIVLVTQPQLLEQRAQVITSYSYCFLAGTDISSPTGPIDIEKVTTNDSVYSYNENDGVVVSKVSNLHKSSRDYYYHIVTNESSVDVTAEHPFYVGHGNYTEVKNLKVGDTIYTLTNNILAPTQILVHQRINKVVDVYNLTVENTHTYFANGYAVHNKYNNSIICDPATPCISPLFCNESTGYCTNPMIDNNYCGLNGKVCSSSETCVQGNCLAKNCGATGGYECNSCSGALFCNTDTSITCGDWRTKNCTNPKCGDGMCNENAASCTVDCGHTNIIDCGGTQCAADDCHCATGNDLCTSLVCDSATHASCDAQNRAWCSNMMGGNGMTCCVPGYICNPNGEGCVPGTNTGTPNPPAPPTITMPPTARPTPSATPVVEPSPTPTPTRSPSPSPSATPIVAQCVSTNIYTPTWSPITVADFYNLPAGGQVYFCTLGSTNGLTFDKARFTINGVLRPEVILQRPGGSDFCDLYTIPANTYSFTVQGEIHHTTLGWQ